MFSAKSRGGLLRKPKRQAARFHNASLHVPLPDQFRRVCRIDEIKRHRSVIIQFTIALPVQKFRTTIPDFLFLEIFKPDAQVAGGESLSF